MGRSLTHSGSWTRTEKFQRRRNSFPSELARGPALVKALLKQSSSYSLSACCKDTGTFKQLFADHTILTVLMRRFEALDPNDPPPYRIRGAFTSAPVAFKFKFVKLQSA